MKGELADRAARRFRHQGSATMSCLASIGARDRDTLFIADLTARVLLIDGCPKACSRRTFEQSAIRRFAYFNLRELGFRKGASQVTDERIRTVVNKAVEVLKA
jgi:uncharacterized metal-binding protein